MLVALVPINERVQNVHHVTQVDEAMIDGWAGECGLEKLRYVHDVICETRSRVAGGGVREQTGRPQDNTSKLASNTADAAENTAEANEVAEQSRQESDAVPEQQEQPH